jgi:hypothetical protein
MSNGHVPHWWQPFKDFYLVYLPLRFNIFVVGLLAFLFLKFPQGHDIIARMAGQSGPSAAIAFDIFVFLLALQIWFWSRQLLYLVPKDPPASRFPIWTRWIPRALGICVFSIAFGALIRVDASSGKQIGPLFGLLVALFVVFLVFVIGRRLAMKTPADTPKQRVRDLSIEARLIFVVSIVGFVIFLALSCSIKTMAALTSGVILFGVSAVWVATGSLLVYLGHRWGMPLMTFALVLAFVLSPWADNHVIKTQPPPLAMHRDDPEGAFEKWIGTRQTGSNGTYPVFFVVTEGGGIRAAYWTAAVLARLHNDTNGKFTEHTFAISSVSGGSLGAIVFDTTLATGANAFAYHDVLKYDALAPTVASAMGPDLLQRFFLPAVLQDRARALELGWEEGWRTSGAPNKEALAGNFLDMFAKHGQSLPSLFLNGTIVETGERIVTSNCHIEWSDAFDGFDEVGGDLKLTTASGMSSRFPYISPAGTMIKTAQSKTGSRLDCAVGDRCAHVVDGGYFESSAAATAIQLILTVQNAPSWKLKNVRPYIIVIRYVDTGKKAKSVRLAPEVTIPPRALFSTLGARAEFSVNRLNAVGTTASFVLNPTKPALPLGWLLSDQSMAWMDGQTTSGENGRCVAAINALLNTGGALSSGPELCRGQPAPSPMTN